MPSDARGMGVSELAAAYRGGELDPVEVTVDALEAAAAGPDADAVFIAVTAERAMAQAERAGRLLRAGVDVGPLQGVPLAVKDLLDMAGYATTAGSKVLAGRPPAAEDAPVLARLDAAGAVFVGKTNMTELAYSGVGINPHYGTPACTLDPERVPGGSSSGSAVAVGLGWVTAAVGSDTGGSVRIPAALNGLVGLKTTDGLVPKEGATPLSTTLDTLGPIARSVEDAWLLFLAMAALPYRRLEEPRERLTLLAPTTLLAEGLDQEVETAFEEALALLTDLGHEVRVEELPVLSEIASLYPRYGSFASHEALALYETELTQRAAEMDPRVVRRVMEHANRPAKDYVRLSLAREGLRSTFWPDLAGVDAIVAPTVPIVAPRTIDLASDDAFFAANAALLRNTAPFNILGCPAASVPCGKTRQGLSVGLMVVAPPGEEELAMSLALEVERTSDRRV